MLFDLLFFGFPLVFATILGCLAYREHAVRYARPAFCFAAYCAFYLCGGREVLLYVVCVFMIGGSWAAVGEGGPVSMSPPSPKMAPARIEWSPPTLSLCAAPRRSISTRVEAT